MSRSVVSLLKSTFDGWRADNAPRLGAALAFYSVFSLAPLLLIAISIAGFAFGKDAAQGRMVEQLEDLFGREAARSLDAVIQNAHKPASGIVAASFGVVALLIGASGVFGELKSALNIMWNAKPPESESLWRFVRDRFLSFAMVLATGFLLLISLVVSAGLSALRDSIGRLLVIPSLSIELLHFFLSVGVVALIFALIFKFLPDVEIAWKPVWVGALLTSLLFVIGKSLIGFYLGQSSTVSVYGAAGSLIVVLLWVYYSAQILLFGAEFTRVYADSRQPGAIAAPGSVVQERSVSRTASRGTAAR